MSTLSCHVLNTTHGQPASGIEVTLYLLDSQQALATGITDTDGRVRFDTELTLAETYTLNFATKDYCQNAFSTVFFPKVDVHFYVDDQRHYHIPLLLSPYSYSTYRGS